MVHSNQPSFDQSDQANVSPEENGGSFELNTDSVGQNEEESESESEVSEESGSSRSQIKILRSRSEARFKEVRSELILKEKTPWMQDLELQVERVLAILDKAIAKLKILTMIPKLMDNDGESLLEFLNREDADFVCRICNKYLQLGQKSVSLVDRLILPYLRDKKDKLDPQMTNVLNVLYKCQALQDKARVQRDPSNEQTQILITYLQKLKDTIKIKLNVSAEEEAQREVELQRAFSANILCRAEIEKLEELVEKQREELGAQLEAKEELINQYRDKIDMIQSKFQENIITRIKDSEKQMAKESIASEARRSELYVEAKNAAARYEQVLEQNMIEEKALRAKRTKIETQLASWLAKFDADIGERQTEFEQVQAEYDEEKAAFDALQEKMDEQDEEYVVLMREREEEEMRLFEIKALEFLRNRSARVIQRAWKRYKERKELRKKRRKARAARKAKKLAKKLAGAVDAMKKKGKKKEKPVKVKVEDDESEYAEAIPKTKEDETMGEGQGEEPGEGKEKKAKKGKGKGKGKGKKKKVNKGEIPKSKKDIHITKESDAVAMLDTAFGGQLETIDTNAQFNAEEVKVDLAEL